MVDIQTDTQDEILKIYLRDARLSDDRLVESVGAELNSLMNQSDKKRMIVNLRDVSFMNSSMIGKLVQLNSRCKADKIDLRFCEMNENLTEVFNLMQLQRIMKLHPTEQAASESFDR